MKSSKKLLKAKINVPIYDDDVYLFYGDMVDLTKYLNLAEEYNDAAGMCGSNKAGQLFVAVDIANNKRSIIAHELFHLVMLVLGRSGVKIDMDNNEAGAYLYGWLYERVLPVYGHKV